ncbi:MAG: cyclase family protein [Gammaproteobacteria bacterium]|nr:cyclase family protein [Gammaproteobacteria bacterium]
MNLVRALSLFCLFLCCQFAIAEDLQQAISASKIIDLTQALYEGMPYWPGTEPIEIRRLADYDQGYRMHKFSMWENIGTHVDSPSHFAVGKGKRTIDQLPLNELVLPVLMIDVEKKAGLNSDYLLSVEDIQRWESQHGRIESGVLVVMHTGWHRKFSEPGTYVNQDKDGVLHFPGYSVPAARLLLERDVAGIGIDTMSLDAGNDLSFPVHNVMLAENKYQIENMNNLDLLPPRGATVVIGVLPVRGGSQAQARIFGLIE